MHCARIYAVLVSMLLVFLAETYPELSKLGVTFIQGDIANKQALLTAMQGCDLVFHVASKAGVWGDKESYFSANVDGTENIINACQTLNIEHLVYTSTPSVTFAGQDENGINESQPYADKFLNFYGLSKAIAELKVLKANNSLLANGKKLQTTALRPHLIWGPRRSTPCSSSVRKSQSG